MSSIPKSKRGESKLEAMHKAYQIRTRILQELMLSFGYSEKKQEEHLAKVTSYIRDPEEREAQKSRLREREDDFHNWIIEKERDDILKPCKAIITHLTRANSIYPSYVSEFEERRLEMDRAIADCNELQQELQYIAEVLPSDKNKFMNIVLEVDSLHNMIKKLRQSDNRFLQHLKDTKE